MASEGNNFDGDDFDPRFDPAYQRGYVGRVTVSPPAPVADDAGENFRDLPPLRGNPWVRALWVVAGVLIAAGVTSQLWAQQLQASPTSPSAAIQYVLPATLLALSPWLLGGGLAAAISTMVLQAARWRGRE